MGITKHRAIENILGIAQEYDDTPLWYSIDEYGVCTVAEAKAIVRQRDELLEAAKDMFADQLHVGDYAHLDRRFECDVCNRLRSAIEDGERYANN